MQNKGETKSNIKDDLDFFIRQQIRLYKWSVLGLGGLLLAVFGGPGLVVLAVWGCGCH